MPSFFFFTKFLIIAQLIMANYGMFPQQKELPKQAAAKGEKNDDEIYRQMMDEIYAQIDTESLEKQRVLVVASCNAYILSHFKFAQKIGIELAKQPFVEKLLLLVPLLDVEKDAPSKNDLPKNMEMRLVGVDLEKMAKLANYPTDEELGMSPQVNRMGKEWQSEDPKLLRLFRMRQDYLLFQMLAMDPALIEELTKAEFTLAINEWFHLGALQLYPLMNIPQWVMTRTLPLDTVFYKYMGLLDAVKALKVPERRALLRDGKSAMSESIERISKDHDTEWAWNEYFYKKAEKEFAEIYKFYGNKNFAGFQELISATKVHFLNLQLELDFPQITELANGVILKLGDEKKTEMIKFPESIKFIGGFGASTNIITVKMEQATSDLFSTARKNHYKGIVLISFGTVLRTQNMRPKSFKTFIRAILQFPEYLFVWKFEFGEKNYTKNLPKNLRILRSVQQPIILAYPKTVAFLSHCGYNSILESVSAGVPLVCMPVFSDQPYNSYAAEKQGIALSLDIAKYTSAELVHALRQIIHRKTEKSFMDKVENLRQKMKHGQRTFLEAFVKLVMSKE